MLDIACDYMLAFQVLPLQLAKDHDNPSSKEEQYMHRIPALRLHATAKSYGSN